MKRTALSARGISAIKRTGYHSDGVQRGLYLQVADGAQGLTYSWVFRYTSPLTSKRREMGIGPMSAISLATARTKAQELRAQVLAGNDPIVQRNAVRIANKLEHANQITFDEASEKCIEARRPEWRNAKHADQWKNTLNAYASPVIGGLPVRQISTDLILKVLEPIWLKKTETARRVRQRMETVLDWCKARGYLTGENPARFDGHLSELLASPAKVQRIEHHPALPFQKINSFVHALRTKTGTAPLALEFLIQTATRTGEVIGARWEEIDMDSRVWTIPAERMKAGNEHRVPLNNRAVEILSAMQAAKQNSYVFPGWKAGEDKGLSSGAFLALMKQLPAFKGYVPHGFRSSFRDWASERTSYANETLELALAHTIKNKVEAAYRREDQLEKRKRLMADWGTFIEQIPIKATVTSIRKASRGKA